MERKRYGNTKINELSISFNRIHKYESILFGEYDGGKICSNQALFVREGIHQAIRPAYFLLDNDDLFWAKSWTSKEDEVDIMYSLETFLKSNPEKKIYIRSFKLICDGFEDDCVFVQDILDIIREILRKQGDRVDKHDEALEKYQELCGEPESESMIGTLIFQNLLSDLDIDQSLITIVNDLPFTITTNKLLQDGTTVINVVGPDGSAMVPSLQVVLSLFQQFVCGINWKPMTSVMKEFRTCVLTYMRSCTKAEKKTKMMSSLASVDALVAAFHHQCRFKPAFNSKFDYKLEHLAHDSTVPISDYCRTCDHYGLPMFRQSIQSNDGRMLVYQARLFMAVGWLKVFFNDDPKLNGIRDLVMDGLSFLVPRTELKEYQKFLVDVVFPKGLYAENTWFSPHHLEDPHKERDDRISKLAEQAQKRAQKLQEKRNAKKKKEVAPAIPQNPPAQVVPVAQNPKEEEEEEKVEFDLQKFVAEQGLVYDEKSGKFVYEKDLEQVEELDEPASPEDAQDEQNENKSRKKNRRRKKRSPVAEVEGTVEDPEPIVHVEPEPQEPELPQPEEVPPEPENPPAAPKDPTKQSNSCPKCLRASDKCKKAISEAAASKKKADKFETKANRTDEVEKKLKEMEQEMGRMRIQLATHLIHSEENAKLRLKISNREVIEEQLRTSRREISLKNELLENENQVLKEKLNKMELAATKTAEETLEKDEKIAELEKSVDELTIKTHTQFEERAQLEELITRKKHELLLKNRACSKLQSENEVLTRRVENLENENEKLRNSAPGPSNQSEILELNRKKLIELRKMKDDFGKNKVLEEANQMMERLKTLPIDPDSLEAAESELLQLESFIENYKDFLDLNARIFQKTNNPSKLLQLPEYPKLSDDFLEIYSKPFPIVPPITGVPDTDCLICHEYREPDQEVQACTNCPYIYHLECLKDWFKEKPGQTTCPQCQHTLRDPQEYPELK